jgi:hypothetical protein
MGALRVVRPGPSPRLLTSRPAPAAVNVGAAPAAEQRRQRHRLTVLDEAEPVPDSDERLTVDEDDPVDDFDPRHRLKQPDELHRVDARPLSHEVEPDADACPGNNSHRCGSWQRQPRGSACVVIDRKDLIEVLEVSGV